MSASSAAAPREWGGEAVATHVTDNELAQRLAAAFAVAGSASAHPWLWRCLLQLLARGEPVTEDELAAATRRPAAEVRAALAALPDTEYDDADRIVGSGITFRPTPHRFEVDGRQLYTWCALDTLIFPAILDRPARVTSPCRATGAPIHLEISPAGITAVAPEEPVVSLVMPSDGCSIRTGFCDHVHFFVLAVATHAVFSPPARQRLDESALSEVVVTDTLPLRADASPSKLTVVSVAPLIASVIRAVFADQSVAEIFHGENLESLPGAPPRPA
jgi:alkylmercury lyase